jgi:hypothetical protein
MTVHPERDQTYSFADLGNGAQPLGQCVCGRGPTIAQFALYVREYKPDRKGLGKQHGSLTRARCESCCVELFLFGARCDRGPGLMSDLGLSVLRTERTFP